MQLIQNNPYRNVGILVGATAREQVRQIKRLNQFIDAGQEPEADFSFPVIGELVRTVDSVTESASKLNLDSDKMNASLFWFYNGNPITDEPAFDALKDGDSETAIAIWRKLAYDPDDSYNLVTKRNASAFHNLSTIYLQEYGIDEEYLQLKMLFLESDYFNELKVLATDATFKISKKEIQLLFLNSLLQEEDIEESEVIDAVSDIEFSAKAEFMKGFVQKPIEQLEKRIEETRKKQKANPAKAGEYGNELYKTAKPLLSSIVSILGKSDIKTISISDKLANEILQCSINLFNHFHETETEVGEIALDLNKKAKSIALGSVVKERITESTPIVERYIRDRPEREKLQKIKVEFEFIGDKLEKFQSQSDTVSNAKALITTCKPKLLKIKRSVGASDELYINLSSSLVQNSQNMLVQAVNEKLEAHSNLPSSRFGLSNSSLETLINDALDTSYNLGTFDMNSTLKLHYKKNLEGIKSLAKQLGLSTLSPKEKLQNELNNAERKLKEIQSSTFFRTELSNCQAEMNKIKEWQFMRSQSDKDTQIYNQQRKINTLLTKSEEEKRNQISNISNIKSKIKNAEY